MARRYFTDEVMEVLIREFQTQDEEMKKIVRAAPCLPRCFFL